MKIGNTFCNFFLKADNVHVYQYMHLDNTFNVLSNGTNYKSQFHRYMGDFGGKFDFSQFSPKLFKRACHKPLSFDNVKLECVNSQIFFKLKQWKAFTDYF